MQMMRQIEYSLFDFRIHLRELDDKDKSVQQILDAVRQEVSVVPIPTYNQFQNGFSHIFDGGYAAGYYSYKWAEVLSSEVFEKFKEMGLFNSDTGKLFLIKILEQGESQKAMHLFVDSIGREPTVDALLKHNGIVK